MQKKIIELINRLFIYTDQQRWNDVMNCFANKVILDYTSFTGGEISEITPKEITDSWEAFLPKFNSTHHQVSNFVVEMNENTADVFCYGTASHFFPNKSNDNVWNVVGSYDFHLKHTNKEWKIDMMKFNFKYQNGNLELPKIVKDKKKWN